jgi:phage replication-related protein YjqB (UPF0714/DUF867 family)
VADRYANFQALAQAEHEGHDFRVIALPRSARYAIVAPHGGNIEPGTSEIAQALAAHDHACYVFEGVKYYGNAALHITSARFDEPRCIALLQGAHTAITVHGESSDTQHVFLGGLDVGLRSRLGDALRASDFSVALHSNPKMHGVHPSNICNRARSGLGVQLEISRGLRETFFASMTEDGRRLPTPRLNAFVNAVRQVLALGPTAVDVAPCFAPRR